MGMFWFGFGFNSELKNSEFLPQCPQGHEALS